MVRERRRHRGEEGGCILVWRTFVNGGIVIGGLCKCCVVVVGVEKVKVVRWNRVVRLE